MRIYLAGLYTTHLYAYPIVNEANACFRDLNYPWMLESYHYINTDRLTSVIHETKGKVFLDSGAFSAFTLGVEINKETYGEYINTNREIIECASVLDAIGDPVQTLKNQEWFDQQKIDVLPCFHFGEPIEYLEHYIKNYPRITLGGMVPINKMVLRDWLDHLFAEHICDADGLPKVKVHGFGMTTWDLLFRYPWHSVDSTSWVMGSKLGSIYITLGDKQFIVSIAEGANSEKQLNASFASLPKIQQEVIEAEIESHGYTIEALKASWQLRNRYNCDYFRRIQERGIQKFKPDLIMEGLF
jgi:hypothetical protein